MIAFKEYKTKDDSPVSAPSSPESDNNIFGEHYMEYGFMDQEDKIYDNSLNNLVIFPDQSPVNIYNSMTEESLGIYIDGTF